MAASRHGVCVRALLHLPEQGRGPGSGAQGPATGAEQPHSHDGDAEPEHQPPYGVRRTVNAVPPQAGATTAPAMATPSVVPLCRPDEASEATIPATERGMPATADLVIDGLTAARNRPNSR